MKKLAAWLLVGATVLSLASPVFAIEQKIGIGTVSSDGLRLRAAADESAEILTTAPRGDRAVIIRKSGDWYLVDYNLHIGYMSANYMEFDPVKNIELGYGLASESSVNVRSAPSADSDCVVKMPLGDKAYIIGFNNGWYKVQYHDHVGYIRSDLLELTQIPVGNSGSGKTLAATVIDYAKQYLGSPYAFGGSSPSGFDCSGFTGYVMKNFGVYLGRTAADQLSNGYSISRDQLAVGDLVFFNRTYGTNAAASHVGIYIGGGQFIHSGNHGVSISGLGDAYYASRYVGARRVL